MSESLRIRPIFAFAAAFVRPIHDWGLRGATLIFWPLALLTLMSLALQPGAWHTEIKIAGPFAAETNPPRASLVLEVPQPPFWMLPLVGDDGANPFQSTLELRINGREMGPPHSPHETIRDRKTTGFSHWGSGVIFSLPEGVNNNAETMATLRYSVRPWAPVTFVLTVASALLGCLIYLEALSSSAKRLGRRSKAVILRAP